MDPERQLQRKRFPRRPPKQCECGLWQADKGRRPPDTGATWWWPRQSCGECGVAIYCISDLDCEEDAA